MITFTYSEPFSLKKKILLQQKPSSRSFDEYLLELKQYMRDEKRNNETYLELTTKALVGDRQAIAYFINEIDKYVRDNPYTGTYPSVYPSLVEALYQEWKGFGPAYKWFYDRSYADSSGLQIIGKQIFVTNKGKYELYPYSISSDKRVEQLRRTLLRNDERIKMDASKPSAELHMNDPLWPSRFIRIAIWMPDRVWEGFTTITMRRQIVEYLSLEDQAGTGSIPYEAVSMIEALALTYRKTVIAGPVNSGKSTFANTIVGTQLHEANKTLGVVMIEKHPESILPYVIKGHRIIPVRAKDEELMEVGIESLRHDPNIIYLTEMRFNEWQFFLFAGEKGYDGITGTYHTTDSEDIPYQAAHAVYANTGGSLTAHMLSALKACEMVYIMKPEDDGQKRLERISEIQFDKENKRVLANDIMRWDKNRREWLYNDKLSPSIIEKMNKKDPTATKRFLNELTRLSAIRRIKDPIKESYQSQQALEGK